MISELLVALPVLALVYVLPGWFWSLLLVPRTGNRTDLAERLAYSVGLSLALVPVVALIPARLFGLGVTLPVAVAAPLVVLAAGALLYRRFAGSPGGGSEKPVEAVASAPAPPSALALVPVGLALVLVLIPDLQNPDSLWLAVACEGWRTDVCVASGAVQQFTVPTALLLALSGAVYALTRPRSAGPDEGTPEESVETDQGRGPSGRLLRGLFVGVVVAVLVRGYWGVVAHDWPFIRGLDHYSHAVMANMIMSQGSSEEYLIYPPGFHTMTAILSRLTGLDPLEIFSVAGPLVLLLPTLSLYALARRLWGRPHGIAAAALAGIFMGGTYYFFNDAMYPNMTASQFLLVLAISALVGLYASPSWRGVALLVLLGASVFLYHPVASSYMALLMAFVSVTVLPYLLLRDRSRGVPLFLAFALLTALAVLYAWDTYDVGRVIGSRLGGGSSGTTATAVGQAVGTQIPYEAGLLIASIVSQPVFWLGTLGAVLLLADLRGWRASTPATLARLTVLGWAAIIFAGSRTTFTGFPQRFGRDLGAPLSVLGAVAVVAIVAALFRQRRAASAFAVSVVVLLGLGLLGIRAAQSYDQALSPSPHLTISQPVAEAGRWLEENNRGGNIMVSPERNQVPSRMMLAMGDYSALQSFTPYQIENPRDLPPYGPGPLSDVLYVMENPAGERVPELLRKHDVDYIVLYKRMPDRPTVGYWRGFKEHPDLYRTAFENESVLIVERR
jgi:hypothetical protein